MITHDDDLLRVTVTLPRVDVDLLDRLARLEGLNRSAELRGILEQFRPMLRQTVEAFEAALAQRSQLDEAMALAAISKLEALVPEAQRLQDAFLGAVARLEGAQAAHDAREAPDSNTGATDQ
ncbi:ribbon-helix-helix protein, CopG family [Microbacterium sp. NPDC055312]